MVGFGSRDRSFQFGDYLSMTDERTATGARALDNLLGGGLQPSEVTFIYGEAASGKTTLALSIVVSHIRADPGARAYYVDADRKFSLPRFVEIASVDASEILKRFTYSKLENFEEQATLVEDLFLKVQRGDIVVFDSITGLYRVETGDSLKTWAVNKELNRQLGHLKEMALIRGIVLLLTGQVRSVLDTPTPQIEPVAQRLLRYWSDTIIRMETTPRQGIRRVIVEKPESHRGVIRVNIAATGIIDVEEAY
jgi:DNA repair protein RadB